MRLIDLDSFPMLPNKLEGDYTEYERGYIDAQRNMCSLPTIDAVEVVHGEWNEVYEEDEKPFFHKKYYCSNCGDWNTYGETNYCPNCGAKMEVYE